MAISPPRSLVEFIVFGPTNDRRQLQDSPILGDVWIDYGRDPGGALELLITPNREHPAGAVACSTLSEFRVPPPEAPVIRCRERR